jgi:hypothetical protein
LLRAFVISALDGGDWSGPYHGRFNPVEGAPVAGKLDLDAVEKRKFTRAKTLQPSQT